MLTLNAINRFQILLFYFLGFLTFVSGTLTIKDTLVLIKNSLENTKDKDLATGLNIETEVTCDTLSNFALNCGTALQWRLVIEASFVLA